MARKRDTEEQGIAVLNEAEQEPRRRSCVAGMA